MIKLRRESERLTHESKLIGSGPPPGTKTLAENITLCAVLNIYNPKWANGGDITLGNTILVTKEGPRILENIPIELAVV